MQQNLDACECISPKDKDTNVFLLIVAQFLDAIASLDWGYESESVSQFD